MRSFVACLLFLLPLRAQDRPVVHLSPEDAQYLLRVWQEKAKADAEWKAASIYAFEKYVTAPAIARAGQTELLNLRSVLSGWEYGIDYSTDFELGTPKLKPEETKPCPSRETTTPTDHYQNTIPEKLWLELPK